jgi:DNA-binding transcriptional ArsR family regulator
MLKYVDPTSLGFQALADPTRRGLVDRLVEAPASVSQLAEPLDMTMSAVVQHLQVLEAAGLVRSQKIGRVRTYQADHEGLRALEAWLHDRRTPAERRLDRLGHLLAEDLPPSDPSSDRPPKGRP